MSSKPDLILLVRCARCGARGARGGARGARAGGRAGRRRCRRARSADALDALEDVLGARPIGAGVIVGGLGDLGHHRGLLELLQGLGFRV